MATKRKPSTVKKPPRAGITPPAELDAAEQVVWDELIREATWLTRFDRYNLHVYCCAAVKYNRDPKGASNALVSRLRSTGAKLRFDDPPNRKSHIALPERTAASKYFDDGPESTDETRARMSREIGRKYFGEDDT